MAAEYDKSRYQWHTGETVAELHRTTRGQVAALFTNSQELKQGTWVVDGVPMGGFHVIKRAEFIERGLVGLG